ncbi:hypothetical protein [Labilibaculum sp.]|uniref:hypothetical protein n=1 Tax=Labilibaculum sp. TaxID=2060723 RepID=UPI00356965F8
MTNFVEKYFSVMTEKPAHNFKVDKHIGGNLKAEIESLQKELELIKQKTNAFEALIRSHLIKEIIEMQELSILYKKLQQAKKAKRKEQKQRGKNYKEPVGIKPLISKPKTTQSPEEKKEIKRLYREAMLQIHPDKFSLEEEKIDLSTELCSKLIDIYQSGNLLELQLFHRHIISGNAMNNVSCKNIVAPISGLTDAYLRKEKERVSKLLLIAKNKHCYKVLTEYTNPLLFVDELKIYYTDKIAKLRKRTRKAL